MQLNEQAVLLGARKSLAGIITRAIGADVRDKDIAIVILNTGIVHRVGHHRMYVTFSRALARAGYTVLRFDFSGIGDSDRRTDGLSPLESSLADIKDAIDWLEAARNVKHVVAIGLCAGADHAVQYAANDTRIVGLVLMEPSIPPTKKFLRNYIVRRLLRLSSWVNVVFGPSRIRRMAVERVAGLIVPDWEPKYPTLTHPKMRSQLEQMYQSSVDRGVQFLVVLAAHGMQNYREQLLEAFPNVSFFGQLRLEIFDCDHKFTAQAIRSSLLSAILDWLQTETFRRVLMVNSTFVAAKYLMPLI